MSSRPPVRMLLIALSEGDAGHIRDQIGRTNVEADIHVVNSLDEISAHLGAPCRCDAYDAVFLDNTMANGQGVANVHRTREILCQDVALIVYTDNFELENMHEFYDAGADEILEQDAGAIQLLSAMIKSQRTTASRKNKRVWAATQSSYVKDISARLDSAMLRRRAKTPQDLTAVTDAQHI